MTVTILPNGDLRLTVDENDADTLSRFSDTPSMTILQDLLEPYSSNGSFAAFSGADANPFVGLTSAPCIAEALNYSDPDNVSIIGRLWYFENYAIYDEIEELINQGFVDFQATR